MERLRIQILGAGYVPRSSRMLQSATKREVWVNAYWKTPEMAKRTKVWRTTGVKGKIHIGRVKSNTSPDAALEWPNETFELYLPSLEELEEEDGRGYELELELSDGGSEPLARKRIYGKSIKSLLFMEGSSGVNSESLRRYRRRSVAAAEGAAQEAIKAENEYQKKVKEMEKQAAERESERANMTATEEARQRQKDKREQSEMKKELRRLKEVAERKHADAEAEKKAQAHRDAAKPPEMS